MSVKLYMQNKTHYFNVEDVYDIETIYCTVSPCIHCVKLLLNTSAQRIVSYGEKYVDCRRFRRLLVEE
jgi:deoxycytidylate deaminase